MRCLLAAIGSRGDVEPFVLLAGALAARGHRVTLALDAGHHEGAPDVPGVTRVALGDLDAAELRARVARAVTARTPLERSQGGHAGFVGEREDELRARLAALAAGGPEAVVLSEDLLFAATPTVIVAYTPARPAHLLLRTRPGCLHLAALSPALYAGAPPELLAAWTFTGFWIKTGALPLDRRLEAFLAAGEAPFFLTMGSMVGFDAPALAAAFVAAARSTGRRAILQRGWAGLDAPAAGDLLVVDEVDYAALFPRCAALFVHGGTGTVAHALRAGRPIGLLPLVNDQLGWADALNRSGNGLGVWNPFAPRPEAFAAAMRNAGDLGILATAAALAARMADEDGLAAACAAIEGHASRRA